MTTNKLREIVFREPFRPLRMTLQSGKQVDVRHPETILIQDVGCVIADDAQDLMVFFEAEEVSSVEYLGRTRARK